MIKKFYNCFLSVFLILMLSLIFNRNVQANPNFTIGSNPYLTVFAYPHDLLKWPDHAVVLYMNPQTLPWQGNVTDISKRPSASYTNNYQNVEFAVPSNFTGNPTDVHSWMEVSAYAYKDRYTAGWLKTSKYGKFLVELGLSSTDMELKAEGIGRAYETAGESYTYYMVPFEGETKSSRNDIDFKVTFAKMMFNRPVGLKFRYIRKGSGVPSGFIKFNREGEQIETPHLTWGWATTGCNHIFGYSHINTDAFYQNSFTVYSGRQIDFQLSFEHGGKYKTGIRYRSIREDGENYNWEYDDGSDQEGNYYIDEQWKDRKSYKFIRGYEKVRFWKFGNLDLGVLFFLQYGKALKTDINKLAESEPDSKESEREIIIETNPFVNYKTKKGYFDFGFLVELSRTGKKNTRTRWNSVSGSEQPDVLWSTSPYYGWTPSWENFSEGRTRFFATGFEANSSVNVYKRLSILTTLLVLKKYTSTKKSYGSSEIPDGGNSFEFNKSHQRTDSKSETWMTGSVGFMYGFGPVQTLITLQFPLAYLLTQKTELKDNSEVLFEHQQKNMWQVQEPITTRVLFIYALGGRPKNMGGHPGR